MNEVYEKHVSNYPRLNIGERIGPTGYIDFLEESDLNDRVSFGVDKFGRKFIVIKFLLETHDGKKENRFQTFFQRYSDNTQLWMGAGKSHQLMDTCGGMEQVQIKLIDDTLSGSQVNFGMIHRPHDHQTTGRVSLRPQNWFN